MATANDILAIVRKELGTKECPAGSNKMKYNTWYYGKPVSGSAYPWCMVFVQWVFNKCGARDLLPALTASCTSLMNAANECRKEIRPLGHKELPARRRADL